MFCKYCGTKLMDSAAFCHECGKATAEQPVYQQHVPPAPPVQPVYQQPVPPVQPVYRPVYQQPAQPMYPQSMQPAADPQQLETLEKQALIFGILGLSLCMLGVPGIVFSSISASKANTYKKLTGSLTGKALIGYRLAKPGKIVGIIMTVLLSILIPALLEGEVTYYYSDPYNYY